MKKAFTLIELLVVIAIIAILAAILFPVFAQAKAAAKKTASLSNVKQNMLGLLMYNGDNDDLFAPVVSWSGPAPAFFGGTPYQPWSWLVLPYMKSTDILQDPQAPSMEAWPAVWNVNTTKALAPQYGLNYQGLSPVTAGTDTAFQITPVSSTSVESPSETVALAAKFSTSEDALGASGTYWAGAGSWTTVVTVEGPECFTIVPYCFVNWGVGSWYDTDYLNQNKAAGAKTGGVSLRNADRSIVSWVDGHASANSAGQLAKGTNFTFDTAEASVVFTDETLYLWDSK